MTICYSCGVTLNQSTGHARRDVPSSSGGMSITNKGTIRSSGYTRYVRRSMCWACTNQFDDAIRRQTRMVAMTFLFIALGCLYCVAKYF